MKYFALSPQPESDQATTSLQEIQGTMGHVKHHYKYAISKIQAVGNSIGQMIWFLQQKCKGAAGEGRE